MRVGVDEAGGEGLAGGDHLPVRAGAAEVADAADPVAGAAHVTDGARPAGAVEERGVTDDEVAAEGHGRGDSWRVGAGPQALPGPGRCGKGAACQVLVVG